MWYLYVLYSANFQRHYIGIAENIAKRLVKHNSSGVRSTKAYRPWKIIYKKEFKTKKEARIRELELKNSGNKRKELFESIDQMARSSNG